MTSCLPFPSCDLVGCVARAEQDGGRVLPELGDILPGDKHRLGRAEQRGHQEVRPRGLVPGVRGVPRARVVLQLHRLPGALQERINILVGEYR